MFSPVMQLDFSGGYLHTNKFALLTKYKLSF